MAHRYGRLGTPEEKARIEVVEDPVKTTHAAYKVWLPIAQAQPFRYDNAGPGNANLCETLYTEAARLLRPGARAFGNLQQGQLDAILAMVTPKSSDASGLFLSALVNETDLPGLDGILDYNRLGYRLAPDKTLVLRAGILYGGSLKEMGRYACGKFINRGTLGTFAMLASRGLQINYGTVYHELAEGARGGLQVSVGKAKIFAHEASGGVQVIYGELQDAGSIGLRAAGGVQVDCNESRQPLADSRHSPFDRRELFDPLEVKLIQLKHFYARDEPVTGVRIIKPDPERQRLEDEITALGKQIEEAAR